MKHYFSVPDKNLGSRYFPKSRMEITTAIDDVANYEPVDNSSQPKPGYAAVADVLLGKVNDPITYNAGIEAKVGRKSSKKSNENNYAAYGSYSPQTYGAPKTTKPDSKKPNGRYANPKLTELVESASGQAATAYGEQPHQKRAPGIPEYRRQSERYNIASLRAFQPPPMTGTKYGLHSLRSNLKAATGNSMLEPRPLEKRVH